MSSSKTYTAKDMERYHNGEMSAAEMHRLEKAALDDPMLADALEGYTYTNSATADLQSLQSRLQQQIEKKEQKKAISFNQQWLKIAALFILLAGGGWLVFQTFSNRSSEFAKSNDSAVEELNRATATDSANTVQSDPPALATDTSIGINNVAVNEQKNTTQSSPNTSNTSSANASATTDKKQSKELNETAAISRQEEASDKRETSDILSLRSSAPAATSSPVRDSTSNEVARIQDPVTEHKEAAANSTPEEFRAKRMADAQSPEPEGGWRAFAKYLTKNLQRPIEAPKNGEVELSFDLDNNGRPVNIAVVKSLCEKCDAEAIRLLKEGPRWLGKKIGGKVKIKF